MTANDQFAITVLTGIAYGILGGTIMPKASTSPRGTALHAHRQTACSVKADQRSKQSTPQFRTK